MERCRLVDGAMRDDMARILDLEAVEAAATAVLLQVLDANGLELVGAMEWYGARRLRGRAAEADGLGGGEAHRRRPEAEPHGGGGAVRRGAGEGVGKRRRVVGGEGSCPSCTTRRRRKQSRGSASGMSGRRRRRRGTAAVWTSWSFRPVTAGELAEALAAMPSDCYVVATSGDACDGFVIGIGERRRRGRRTRRRPGVSRRTMRGAAEVYWAHPAYGGGMSGDRGPGRHGDGPDGAGGLGAVRANRVVREGQ